MSMAHLIRAALLAASLIAAFPVYAGEVDINTATAAQLHQVKGIGEKTAQAIVDYRQKHGPFASVDELLAVKGIGEKTLVKIRGSLTVGKGKEGKSG